MSRTLTTAISTLALAAVVAGCASPTPSPSLPATQPEPRTPAPSQPAAPPDPSTTVSVPTKNLLFTATAEWCGSIGGCAYFISLGGGGETWKAEFGYDGSGNEAGSDGLPVAKLAGAKGLPYAIPAGAYALTLSQVMVSDEIRNGERQFGPTTAVCSTTLDIRDGQPMGIQGAFKMGSCQVAVGVIPTRGHIDSPVGTGQVPYMAGPERHLDPGDVVCPGTEPCGE